MQTNANRSKRYLVLERTHMAIDKEIQKHRINIEIIKKDYVAICDRRRNWELQSGKLRSTTAACNCRTTAEPADFCRGHCGASLFFANSEPLPPLQSGALLAAMGVAPVSPMGIPPRGRGETSPAPKGQAPP